MNICHLGNCLDYTLPGQKYLNTGILMYTAMHDNCCSYYKNIQLTIVFT